MSPSQANVAALGELPLTRRRVATAVAALDFADDVEAGRVRLCEPPAVCELIAESRRAPADFRTA